MLKQREAKVGLLCVEWDLKLHSLTHLFMTLVCVLSSAELRSLSASIFLGYV